MDRPNGNSTQLQVLLDRAADGSGAAYDELIALASQRLLKLTRKMLRNYPQLRRWEQTDDVFQNAVLRLHRSLADVQPQSVRDFFGLAATQIRRTLIDLATQPTEDLHHVRETFGHESGGSGDPRRTGRIHFLVMEYVEGRNLHKLVRLTGPLPIPTDVVEIDGKKT